MNTIARLLAQLRIPIPVALGGSGSVSALNWGVGNKLLNPGGSVNQRGYVSGAATSAALQYTLDRWRVVTSGQSLVFVASGNGYKMTGPAGGVEQVIPGEDMEGGIYTLSWVGSGTATVNGTAITNGGQTTNLTAGSNCTIRFIGEFERPQFELGGVKTQYASRPRSVELERCQWFFEEMRYGNGAPNGFSIPASNRAVSEAPQLSIFYKRVKRAVPTIVFVDVLAGTQARFVSSSGVYPTGVIPNFITIEGFQLSFNTKPVASYGWVDQLGRIRVDAEINT